MVSFLPTFPVLFMSLVLCLNIFIFPSLLYCCKRFTSRRSLDVSDPILSMIPPWRMTATSDVTSRLPLFIVSVYLQTRRGGLPPLSLFLSSPPSSPPGVQCDPHRHPTGRPAPLPLSPSCFIAIVYMTSLGKAPPLKVLDSIGQYRSNRLPLIEKILTP